MLDLPCLFSCGEQLLKQLQYNKHALQCAGQTADENAKRCEELIAWVKTMKSALVAKMSNTVTDDSVDAMLKDQIVRSS